MLLGIMDTHAPPVLYAVDLRDCATLAGQSPEAVCATFVDTLERAGATVVHAVSHVFPGDGLTSVLVLSESHAVIHTWPESGTAHIDIFSCSSRLRSLEAIAELGRAFGARDVSVREVPRADGHVPPSNARR
jgi:S-adenosylmethionine decarboxylase proenzyme